jgi:exopolyphosphatase/guanosine-5'-triphosphate,3'-diphosphate pyrophosphatase
MSESSKNVKAIADLGSNSFHLLLGGKEAGKPSIYFRKGAVVGIGRNGMSRKEIVPDALERALSTLRDFSEKVREMGLKPEETRVLATSAFRNASNSAQVLASIHQETGFLPEIISGEEEARLIFAGVRASGAIREDESALIMDIGGGSVEFILWDGFRAAWKQSFEAGSIRLTEEFHKQDPMNEEMRKALEDALEIRLKPLWDVLEKIHPAPVLVGSSGSYETLFILQNPEISDALNLPAGQAFEEMNENKFDGIFHSVWQAPLQERLALPAMPPYRAEIIPSALILMNKVLKMAKIQQIRFSHFAMKEGALFESLSDA